MILMHKLFMITNIEDLYRYINYDRYALGGRSVLFPKFPVKSISRFIWIWKIIAKDYKCSYKVFNYQVALRFHEYYANKISTCILDKIALYYWKKRHESLGYLLGFDIPINVFGPGLRINHYGLIVVNGNVRVGSFCDIHQGVNIGNHGSNTDVPIIGDNVWIGPGAKLFGKIEIASGCAIGANAVVNKSFSNPNKSIAGIPAHEVSDKGNLNIRVYTE